MKPSEIEYWALRVIETVTKRSRVEDSRVELKARWPDSPVDTGRQIAAHANAARGENILWLIGVDEENGVVGADNKELADWIPQMRKAFDGEFPACVDVCVTFDGKTVVALCFDTSRVPFVVKNPEFGRGQTKVQREVPWREGSSTRTATRNDLILLLAPLRKLPRVDFVSGYVQFFPGGIGWQVSIRLYVSPCDNTPIAFPFYKCKVAISTNGQRLFDEMSVSGEALDKSIQKTGHEIRLNAPTMVRIEGQYKNGQDVKPFNEVEVMLKLFEAVSQDLVTVVCGPFRITKKEGHYVWGHQT